jgi:threonine dehydrogenase-like Zn-dependent dehydrogenase
VACGEAGYANHAEINFISKNLAIRVPNGVALEAAGLITVDAIALHGFRQSGASLDKSVVIVGSGLVGFLTLKIAKAAA